MVKPHNHNPESETMNVPRKLPLNLRFEDVGMLAWLMVHAGSETVITESVVIDASPAAREGVRSILRRLEAANLIERRRTRDAKGRIAGVEYKITGDLKA